MIAERHLPTQTANNTPPIRGLTTSRPQPPLIHPIPCRQHPKPQALPILQHPPAPLSTTC